MNGNLNARLRSRTPKFNNEHRNLTISTFSVLTSAFEKILEADQTPYASGDSDEYQDTVDSVVNRDPWLVAATTPGTGHRVRKLSFLGHSICDTGSITLSLLMGPI